MIVFLNCIVKSSLVSCNRVVLMTLDKYKLIRLIKSSSWFYWTSKEAKPHKCNRNKIVYLSVGNKMTVFIIWSHSFSLGHFMHKFLNSHPSTYESNVVIILAEKSLWFLGKRRSIQRWSRCAIKCSFLSDQVVQALSTIILLYQSSSKPCVKWLALL